MKKLLLTFFALLCFIQINGTKEEGCSSYSNIDFNDHEQLKNALVSINVNETLIAKIESEDKEDLACALSGLAWRGSLFGQRQKEIYYSLIEYLYKKGAPLIWKSNNTLHDAAIHGDIELVKLLLKFNASIKWKWIDPIYDIEHSVIDNVQKELDKISIGLVNLTEEEYSENLHEEEYDDGRIESWGKKYEREIIELLNIKRILVQHQKKLDLVEKLGKIDNLMKETLKSIIMNREHFTTAQIKEALSDYLFELAIDAGIVNKFLL